MVQAATADVVVRSRKKGDRVYREVQQQLDRLNSKAKLLGKIAAAAAVGGIAVLTARSFESVDALAKHADRLGTSTEKLKTLQILTELTGGSTGNLNKTLIKAQKALGEFAVTGSGTAAPFLRQMNLDTQALVKLRPDELFQVYAKEIRNLGTRAEQTAASAALFGDRTGEMLNLIDAGPEAFAEIEAEVRKYGLALNRVDSAKVEEANDTMLRVRERVQGIGNVIAAKVAPVITGLAQSFLDTGTEAEEMGNVVDNVMNGMAVGVGIVADGLFGLKLIMKEIQVLTLELSSGFFGKDIAFFAERTDDLSKKFPEIFKAGQGPAVEATNSIRSSLEASAGHAREQLEALAASEKPSLAIADALEKAREKAELAAQATAAAREKLQEIGGPTFTESEIDERAREREDAVLQRTKDKLAVKLAALETSLLTEEEREIQSHERRLEILANAEEQIGLSKERAQEIEAQLLAAHEGRLTKITLKGLSDREKFEQKSGKDKAKQVFGDLANITSGVATHNKVLFRINQAAAIGNALVNTYEGVTKSLSAYPMPLAAIMAAAHLAAGLAQVAAIRSASPGGGTTPSAVGVVPTINDQPVSPFDLQAAAEGANIPGTQITIIVEGNLVGDEGIRQLLRETIGDLIDADEILIAPESRQAEEIRSGTGSGG